MTDTTQRCPCCKSENRKRRNVAVCICDPNEDLHIADCYCSDPWHTAPVPAEPPRCLCGDIGINMRCPIHWPAHWPAAAPTGTSRHSITQPITYPGTLSSCCNAPIVEHDDICCTKCGHPCSPTGTAHPLGEEFTGCFAEKGRTLHVGKCSICTPTGTGEGSKLIKRAREYFKGLTYPLPEEIAEFTEKENASLRSQLEEAQRQILEASIPEGKIDAEIVGPIVRKIYGDSAELGHYKLAIEAFKQGREGTLIVLGQLGRAKLRAEKAERDLATAQARIARLEEAMRKLANEAGGFLDMADKEFHGVTNMRVLANRISEARAALAEPQSGDTK